MGMMVVVAVAVEAVWWWIVVMGMVMAVVQSHNSVSLEDKGVGCIIKQVKSYMMKRTAWGEATKRHIVFEGHDRSSGRIT